MEAARPISYSGQGFSLMGEKGRFVLPPDFRKAVRESGQGERVLCVSKHDRWPCLVGFGLSREADLHDQLDREERNAIDRQQPFDRELRAAQLFGFLRVPFDDSGRFVLPDYLISLAALGDRLFFNGAGATFMIWNPAELQGMGTGWEGARAACAALEADVLAGKARK